MSVAGGGWLASANYLGYLLGALSVSMLARRVRAADGIRGGLLVIGVSHARHGARERIRNVGRAPRVAGIGSATVLVFASAWCLERLAAAAAPC